MSKESEISDKKIQNNSIIIRKAKPVLKEGLMFAKLFNEASEGFFKSMLGIKTFEIIADAFVKSNNEYSFENVIIIEYESKIVGMLSGYTYSEKKEFKKNIFSQFPNGAKFRILMFSVTGKILSHFLGPRGEKDYYLQAIAVNSQMQGKGLGQKLLNQCMDIAIKKGSKTLILDVSSKNATAIKSYLKFGMEIFSYWPNFLNLPPVFTRMEKKL